MFKIGDIMDIKEGKNIFLLAERKRIKCKFLYIVGGVLFADYNGTMLSFIVDDVIAVSNPPY